MELWKPHRGSVPPIQPGRRQDKSREYRPHQWKGFENPDLPAMAVVPAFVSGHRRIFLGVPLHCFQTLWHLLARWMTAAARPFTCCEPAFVACQPVNRPGNDGMGDWFPRIPFPNRRVIKTEKGIFGTIPVLVVMWDGLFRFFSSSAQWRVNHCHVRKQWKFGTTFFSISEKSDLHSVRSTQGSKLSLPSDQAPPSVD